MKKIWITKKELLTMITEMTLLHDDVEVCDHCGCPDDKCECFVTNSDLTVTSNEGQQTQAESLGKRNKAQRLSLASSFRGDKE